jgi:hypothetical protein
VIARTTVVVAALALALVACNGKRTAPRSPLVDSAAVSESDSGGRLLRDLELEVLASYRRSTLDAAAAAGVIDPSVGLTVFGVGPDDVDLGAAPDERWPLTSVAGHEIDVVSRRLELFLSADRTVGWSYDEISLHLPVCGRTASIPLRVAQVYVRDSERWTQVAEHTAYAQPMGRWLDLARGLDGAPVVGAVEKQLESQAAQAALAEALAPDGDRTRWDGTSGGLAVWPDPLHVLRRGAARSAPGLAQTLGASALTVEALRLALGPGRSVAIASGTLVARQQRQRGDGVDSLDIRLRGTFVLERKDDTWRVRFALVSVPITIGALVGRTIGVAASLESGGRVKLSCR